MTITNGTVIIIHWKKWISMPKFCNSPSAMALGGGPMGVPIPPMLHPNAMLKRIALLNGSSFDNSRKIGLHRVKIIAADAVFEIHTEKNALMIKTEPKMSRVL